MAAVKFRKTAAAMSRPTETMLTILQLHIMKSRLMTKRTALMFMPKTMRIQTVQVSKAQAILLHSLLKAKLLPIITRLLKALRITLRSATMPI